MMKLDDFDYSLPKGLIAQKPKSKRDESRLMLISRETGEIRLKRFGDILGCLQNGDLLVINDTKVFPARIFGKKDTGGKVELLLIKEQKEAGQAHTTFCAMAKSSKPFKLDQRIMLDKGLTCTVTALYDDGRVNVRFDTDRDIYDILDEIGVMPLPPYIKRVNESMTLFDKEHYQTVYAKNVGAVAAPTAGLHFTDELLDRLKEHGVKIARVTLHVGLGTFLPVRVENVLEHKMHEEYFTISDDSIEEIKRTKESSNKVIAVGTTSVRALESAFDEELKLKRSEGNTSLFIYPGYRFKVVDAMITNFHLPKSTLLMLVSAFCGTDLIKQAYKMAVDESFSFFSYGDAMYIA